MKLINYFEVIGEALLNAKRESIVFGIFLGALSCAYATDYYVDADGGSDLNTGTAIDQAWATLAKANLGVYGPGDRILLQKGDVFSGKIFLDGVSGTADDSIVIASYGEGDKPLIDAAGYLAGVQIQNSHYVEARDLEITADGGVTVDGSPRGERYGVLVRAFDIGSTSHVSVRNMTIYEIYPEVDTEHEGKNPTTYLGTGIRLWGIQGTTSSNFVVENCDIRRVGYKAVEMRRVSFVDILDNFMQQIGGPAMQPSTVNDLVVRGNTVDRSGDYSDPRMHGRGSGIWPWGSDRVLIEKNKFMHARGRFDSCGAHIDFNCNDVIVQYNLSWDNEGGFVEILGNNNNCAYRYNISIDDGARIAGVNGASGDGNVLWTSGFVGSGNTLNGPFNSYIYNNTIYVSKGQQAGFRFEPTSDGLLIANNIFFVDGDSVDRTNGTWTSENKSNVVWENNLYQRVDLLPDTLQIIDTAPLIGDPGFAEEGGVDPEDYEAFFFENVKDKGIVVEKIPGDTLGLRIGLEVTEDFFGNPIIGLPDLGAVETGDTRPSLPDTASFEEIPALAGPGQVFMKGIRTFEPVEYYFTEMTGNYGGNDSGWQSERFYQDSELLPNTPYQYQVSMRDSSDQLLLDSVVEDVSTDPVSPFENVLLLEEKWGPGRFLGNVSAPFPTDVWHLSNATSWQRDESGTSVGFESSDGGQVLRLGWGFDEVEIRYFLDQPIGLNRGYRFTGDWRIKSLLENSLGCIVGIGEFDSETGALLRSVKEIVFGELDDPVVDQTGLIEIEVSAGELVASGADPSSFIGVYFHHDDDGTLMQESTSSTSRSDVYLVSDLKIFQLAEDSDTDGDGLGDQFEDAYGLDSDDPSDAGSDLDGDELSNLEEYLFGSDPTKRSTRFLPPIASVEAGTEVLIPAEAVMEGRIYILERSSDLGKTDPWKATDSFSPESSEIGESYKFAQIGTDAIGFFRVRIEWAR